MSGYGVHDETGPRRRVNAFGSDSHTTVVTHTQELTLNGASLTECE